ncbi:MAG: alpha/beta hydrolase [Verrucomicrobiota bacterium]
MKRLLFLLLLYACLLPVCGAPPPAKLPSDVTRTEDIIYGRKFGTALTMDIFQPAKPNGYGIVFAVSGGWFSAKEAMRIDLIAPMAERGYTVFAVVHGSQPKFTIPEVVQDMNRAVRFIRHHAAKYGIKPDKLGVYGGSAGGHLSLTLGTSGGPGNEKARDPIDRESSAIQCVASWFPPTDFLNYGTPGEDAVGVGILKNFKAAFGPESYTAEKRQAYGKTISPLNFVTERTAPTLIIHGDADKLVPIQQAEIFIKAAQAKGVPAKLITRAGMAHGWPDAAKDVQIFADWFDEHLKK